MPNERYVLAIDQGTGSTKATVMSESAVLSTRAEFPAQLQGAPSAAYALTCECPRPGWVEQDPAELLTSVVDVARKAVASQGRPPVAIALSTQRESALAWDRRSGKPLSPVLGWQDRRTADAAAAIQVHAERIRSITGLPLDPMFSALKFGWILDQIDPERKRAAQSTIRLGTVDAFLVARLTGSDQIEVGNASRTQLLDLETCRWHDELCDLFSVPQASLPTVVTSGAAPRLTEEIFPGARGIPVAAVLGDSHAALYAHLLHDREAVKVTYGTGSSVMGATQAPVDASSGLSETIAWDHQGPVRAFEGNILATGGTLVWLAGVLGCSTTELAELAESVPDSDGVEIVPAFAGLAAPWWDRDASGIITGVTLSTQSAHLARAAMDSIVLQIDDVLRRVDRLSGGRRSSISIDGAPVRNDWLVQRQADLSNRTVLRPVEPGLSAIGAGYLAGTVTDLWSAQELRAAIVNPQSFHPAPTESDHARAASWHRAMARSRYRHPSSN